jgi:hypothetical protein
MTVQATVGQSAVWIAPSYPPVGDHLMKLCAVVETLSNQLLKICHMPGRLVGIKAENDVAEVRVQNRNFFKGRITHVPIILRKPCVKKAPVSKSVLGWLWIWIEVDPLSSTNRPPSGTVFSLMSFSSPWGGRFVL